jgi:hypothetical protein
MLSTLRSLVTSLAIASVIGSAAQAYASTQTQATMGMASVSTAGIAVENVNYDLDRSSLRKIHFQVNDPTVSVSVRLRSDGAWFSCENNAGKVACITGDFPISAVHRLEIVAS